jgi:DNA (cytosine-5)-methyltransferase 1
MPELQHKDTETIEVEKLIPYANNPKQHPEEQVNEIASSIKNYGFVQPIVTDADNEIIIGHGRLEAAKKLDLNEVPVIKHEDITEAEAQALRLADNKIADTDMEQEKLAVELDQLTDQENYEELVTGFTEERTSEILNQYREEQEKQVEESKLDLPEQLEEWKILNLYAGIGGNRRFWPDECEITHIEYNEKIADGLRKIHPEDEIIVEDAHKFLLNNFQKYDFIWSSPPCPSHSRMRKQIAVGSGAKPKYPDMKLYEEILFLQGFFEGKWIVENVKSWYNPLIQPQERDRHYYWANFKIPKGTQLSVNQEIGGIDDWDKKNLINHAKKFGLTEEEFKHIPNPSDYPKDKIIRNMVHPDQGEQILKAAFNQKDSDNDIIKSSTN